MARVAVCDDNVAVCAVVRRALEHDGHDVVVTSTATGLMRRLDPLPDVLVLDVGLPDADGRELCLALKARGIDRPVLMLTAFDGLHHKVSGFEAGADDYLTKPFDIPELLLRVKALLRRYPSSPPAPEVTLDAARHVVVLGTAQQSLTPTEFRILGRLITDRTEVVRRPALVAAGWSHGAQVSDNTLDSYIRRIRTKLGTLGVERRLVTVRGVGYRWD